MSAAWTQLPWYAVLALAFFLPISPALSNMAIVIGLIGWVLRSVSQRRVTMSTPRVGLLFLLLGVAGALSMINSVNLGASARGLLKLAKAFGVCLIASEEIKTESRLRRFITVLLLGAIVASLDGLLQWFLGVDPLYHNALGHPLEGLRRVSGPYGHPNDFALFLVFVLPLAVAMVRVGGPWRLRGLGGAAAILLAASLGLTFSRGGLLGIAVALLIVLIVWRAWWWLIGFIGMGCLLVLLVPKPIQVWTRQQPSVWEAFTESNDPHQSRPQIWRAARNMIADHPWVGVGVNTFVLNYHRYRAAGDLLKEPPYAHNDYLHMLAEIGIVGFSAFLALLGAAFRQVVRVIRSLPDPLRGAALGIGCGLAAFLLNGVTESGLYYSRTMTLFWLGVGLLFSAPFVSNQIRGTASLRKRTDRYCW